MNKKGDTGWLSKSQLRPSLPKCKPPRQTTAPETVEKTKAVDVIDVTDSEVQIEYESEDETQFGVMRERYEEQGKEVSDGETDIVASQKIVAKSGKSAVTPEHWKCSFMC
jgi:hypothetical protein